MIYLSGAPQAKFLTEPDIGFMLQPNMGNMPDLSGVAWAADNGCFSQGATFSLGRWISWLEKMAPWRETCLFAAEEVTA